MEYSGKQAPKPIWFATPFAWKIRDWSYIEFGRYVESRIFVLDDIKLHFSVCKSRKFLNVFVRRLNGKSPVLTLHCELCLLDQDGEECLSDALNDTFTFNKDFNSVRLATWSAERITESVLEGDTLLFRCTIYDVGNPDDCVSTELQPGYEKLSEDLEKLFLEGEDHDMTVIVKEVELPAHRAILKARSSVFRTLLTHMAQENKSLVRVNDRDPDCFRDFLLHLYSSKLPKICRENVLEFYIIANKYDGRDLTAACSQFMINDLCVDSFFSYVPLALRHQETTLIDTAKEYFANNMNGIISSPHWLPFMTECPIASQTFILYGLRKMNIV